ncbi:MAG: hypothetical protein RQ966_12970 [Acetobacteraceae bacterium]|nr:hypothetical protein [Acetobacteraceae bacterium]
MDALYTLILVVVLLLSVAAGWWVRSRLHERYLAVASIDSVRLLMGMLLTFSALVLGLLTSNAKQRFDGLNDDLSAFGTDLIELDHRLRTYGSDADPIRTLLRRYTASVIADSWPGEASPGGPLAPLPPSPPAPGLEGKQLGDMLNRVDVEIERLMPADDMHRRLAARLRDRIAAVMEQRWKLIFAARSTIAWPFLLTLTTWLSIIFAIFGMTSPPGRVVYTVAALSALSIASPLYLILDYSDALSGTIALSSAPMRAALAHMDAEP